MSEALKIDHGKMAIDLFPKDYVSDEYKVLVLVLTYRTISENPRIKPNTLNWILRSYNIKKEDIDCALSGLINVFDAVSCWGNEKQYSVSDSDVFKDWYDFQLQENPNLLAYRVKKPHKG
tara:strand:+ start:5325 stop:5684 length:360 start_codon:yes stop_codon:yes gene_type:complete